MLSYSTGESGTGADVDKVRAATELVQTRRPDLLVDGPIQYDAAVDAAVGRGEAAGFGCRRPRHRVHLPRPQHGQQHLQGRAALAGAVAIGPVLQGLNKPVNDLSRGATVARHRQHGRHHGDPGAGGHGGTRRGDRRGSDPFVSANVLVLNSGSSSIKYELVDPHRAAHAWRRASSSASARSVARIEHTSDGTDDASARSRSRRHHEALRTVLALFDELGPRLADADIVAVGHRVVHGWRAVRRRRS